MQEHVMRLLAFGFLPVITLTATATAGQPGVVVGGQPMLMIANPNISLAWEKVTITIHDKHVDSDCVFSFRNDGPTARVRIGLPETGLGSFKVDHAKPKRLFSFYQSFVDGVRVYPKTEAGWAQDEEWEVKMIRFEAGQTRLVREHYHSPVGGGALPSEEGKAPDPVVAVGYPFLLFRLFKGNIKEATLTVRIDQSTGFKGPVDLLQFPPFDQSKPGDYSALKEAVRKPGAVLFRGPGKPMVQGTTLTCHKSNWRPTESDNVMVEFLMPDSMQRSLETTATKGGY